jgi:hypothetical protein
MSSEPTTRDRRMALKIADLIAEAVVEHVSDAEQAAADASGDTDGDKPVVAKLAISVDLACGRIESRDFHQVLLLGAPGDRGCGNAGRPTD